MNWLDSLRSRLFGLKNTPCASKRSARGKNPSRRLTLEYLEDRLTPSVSMVTDLYSYTNGSYPQHLTDVNGTLFFTATDNTGSVELFKSDGTAGGTAELTSGNSLTGFGDLVNLNGKLFFSAYDIVLGYTALWTSDGSVAGTKPFTAAGQNVAVYLNTNNQALVGTKLYFEAWDNANGRYDLWISDGTSAGTHPVQPGTTTQPAYYNLVNFTAVGNKLFFQGADATNYQLWKSDGTAAGTVKVAELNPNQPSNFTAVGGSLYFEEYDSVASKYALWKSDGTTTTMVADIGTTANPFSSLTGFNSKLYFQVYDTADAPNSSYALWSSDGTAVNTGAFKFNGGITPVQTASNTQQIVFNGALYFTGDDTTNGYSLWKTDGVSANNSTATVQTSGTSPFSNSPAFLTVVGSKLFFRSYDTSISRYDLWKTDGTSAGTGSVQPGTTLVAQGIGDYSGLVASNGKVFFTAHDIDTNGNSPHGYELWSSDGTAANTAMVTDINTTTNGSNPNNLTAVGSEIFFLATDNSGSQYLYQSDGTAAGTVRVQTAASVIPTSAQNFTAVGNLLFFTASGPDGYELWTSGTSPNSASPFQHGGAQEIATSISDLINGNGLLYFFAYDTAMAKYALWKSDGTQAGTLPLADLPTSTGLAQLAVAGSNLFFQEYDSVNSTYALWKWNGTTASQVMDISASGISNMTAVGGSVFFQAYDSVAAQYALWTSNGTTTTQLIHFSSGGLIAQIAFSSKLFFDAYNPASGYYSLWMSDGTVAGTGLYLTASGTPVLMPSGNPSFTIMGSNLYFEDFDLGSRFLLAKTDGTPGGYATVQAGSTGPIAQNLAYLVSDNGFLVFQAYDSAHGYELWQSDGTAAGTLLTADILTGPNSSYPAFLTVAGSQVFFNANDGFHGAELWSATITTSTVVTAGLSGPSDGVTEQHRAFVLTGNDSNSGNNSAGFSFAINWGDGTSQTVTGLSGITTDHQYALAGSFMISVTATNLADNVSNNVPFTQTETITQTEIQGGNLALGGVAGNDAFLITPGTTAGTFTVKVNGTAIITNFKPAMGQQIFLYGGNGTTTITITDSGTTADAFVLGGDYVTFKGSTFVNASPASWTVNGNNGADTFTIGGAANASIAGGTGKNTFKFITGGSLTGTLKGGSGISNTLDYSGYATSGVVVDLPLGSATAVNGGANGGISGIRNVTGSKNGGDILVGDANPNVLKALKGHNILIGGSGGGDTLTSGGADILIAGTTSYDSNIAALQTILATWMTSTPANYSTVISTIMSNTFADPLNTSTVFDSGASDVADTLNGSGKATTDWFFAHTGTTPPPDDIINFKGTGDTVTSI